MATNAITVQLAAALVAELNEQQFSQAFTAVRAYVPNYTLEDMDTLHITVVPASLDDEPADRSRNQEEHVFHIAIQKRFRATSGQVALNDADAIMLLVQEIRDYLWHNRLADFQDARIVKSENKPIYDPKHLAELNQITSLLAITYRVKR